MDRLLDEEIQTIVGDYYRECNEAEPPQTPLAIVIAEKIADAEHSKTLKAVGEWLDIEFIINMLKQSQGLIWQRKGQNICRKQIQKLEALNEGKMPE